jgi:anti-sigma factor (TIGR02949 family)
VSAPVRTQLEGLGLSSTCVDVLRHLWDYLDDEMTTRGAERLKAHIASCATCREYEGYQACFLDALAKLRAGLDAPTELREQLATKLKGQGCGCWEKVRKEHP